MDRRSWLWRKKSSDKSPGGETDSSISGSGSRSGSTSSPSEKFSDDHQESPNRSIQSPDVNSKLMPLNEDIDENMKKLTEQLSEALVTISAKEELIKQHVKVAEEAVSGWEKAENEVITLKQELDAAIKKNSSLEDRIVHLDGALKECMRQMRQVREEHDVKIQEAISKNSTSKNSKPEVQNSEIQAKLDSMEKENASLHLELHSCLKQLDLRTIERDLSTKTAENASKQHLESIKRVAKLEAECRKFKIMARKVSSLNDVKSIADSQSDGGERSNDCEPRNSDSWLSNVKNEKVPSNTRFTPSIEIGLMDDFLEMEKIAALSMSENRSHSLISEVSIDGNNSKTNKIAELEEKIKFIESEKLGLDSELTQFKNKLKFLETQFNTCQNQLKLSQSQLEEANKELAILQGELELANELRQAINLELDDASVRREEVESKCREIEDEREVLLSKVSFLEGEVEKGRALHEEALEKCRGLENEISRLKYKLDSGKSQFTSMKKLKEKLEQELVSATKKIESLESQLKKEKYETRSLRDKIGSLERDVESEKKLSSEFSDKCKMSENEVLRMKNRLSSVIDSKNAVNEELKVILVKKEEVESQLKGALDRVCSLEYEMEKERKLSTEFSSKCKKLEFEISKMKTEGNFQISSMSKEELDRQQETELALAASKLAECQKTIASLGNQLKSLANLEDLFLESENMLEVSEKDYPLLNNNCAILDTLSSETALNTSTFIEDNEKFSKNHAKDCLLSGSLDNRSKQGFGKFFLQAKNMVKG